MGPFSLLWSDPVEGDFVSFTKASLEFLNVWPSAKFEYGWEIFVLFTSVSPGEKPGWTGGCLLGKINSVVSVEEPVFMGKVSLVEPDEISVGLIELNKVVDWPFSSGVKDFSTNFPDVVVEGSVGFDSTEPIDWSAINLLDSVIVGDGESLRKNLGVDRSLIFEVEPEFGFTGGSEGISFLGKGLLEVDSTVGRLYVGLDGEKFFVYEIILEEWEGLFFEGGEGLVLVWSGFGHDKDFD